MNDIWRRRGREGREGEGKEGGKRERERERDISTSVTSEIKGAFFYALNKIHQTKTERFRGMKYERDQDVEWSKVLSVTCYVCTYLLGC